MMQGETFVRKDMTEYKNMMNGVRNVTACGNSTSSIEKPNDLNKKHFYEDKVSKISKNNCSSSNISADNGRDLSADKNADTVSLGNKISTSRYSNNNTNNSNSNGIAGNVGNYWMNAKNGRTFQKKTNTDTSLEEGKYTTDDSTTHINKGDIGSRYLEENNNSKSSLDVNAKYIATSSNLEHSSGQSAINIKGNMGNQKSRKTQEKNSVGMDNGRETNGDMNSMENVKSTSKGHAVSEGDNANVIYLDNGEIANDNPAVPSKNYSFSTVDKIKGNETDGVVIDSNYLNTAKDTNGKVVGVNSAEEMCNGYSNGKNIHNGENSCGDCFTMVNAHVVVNETESGNNFRAFKGNVKMCGTDKKHANPLNGMNSNTNKGGNEEESEHMNGDTKSRDKIGAGMENKIHDSNTPPIIEKNGDIESKNFNGNIKSKTNNKNTLNSNINMNKKADDYKNKSSTFSSESGNSASEVHNTSFKVNSTSSNSYHNISSISSLNADAPEFVPSTKSAQNNLPFNNILWGGYYQEVASPFSSVPNSSVLNPACPNTPVANNSNVAANASGLVHNSLMGTSAGIGSPLLSAGVGDGGGTDGNNTNNNLINLVNSSSNSGNNTMSINSSNLGVSNNTTGLITNSTSGVINRTDSSSGKNNSGILPNNRNTIGSSTNVGMTANVGNTNGTSSNNVSGIKHGMHDGNVTPATTTNATSTNNASGGMGNVGNMPNVQNSSSMNNAQAMHNSPAMVGSVPNGGGGSQSNCNFLNSNMIHSNNNLRTTSFMSGSENSTPFHHIGNAPHTHQNYQPNNSLMHPPNFCVNSPYLINNHHNAMTAHQSAMFTPPMSYGNSIPSANGHPEIPFPQAASMYGAFSNNPNVIGNSGLASQKNTGMNMGPYNFLPCVMPVHPQLQPNAAMNMNSMEHYCMPNSANTHMKMPYGHGPQPNRRGMFNHFSNNTGGNSSVAPMHSGTNMNEANFEHNSMSPVMGGGMNYGYNGFNANQSNSMHLNSENNAMHMNPNVGNGIPLNNTPGVICLGAPLHMNNSANMPPSHHHMGTVNSMGNINAMGNVNGMNNSMHMNSMHLNHNVMMNNNTNLNKQKRNMAYNDRNKQYNNSRDNKNAVKNNMMNLNNTVSSISHFNNNALNNTSSSQNASISQNNQNSALVGNVNSGSASNVNTGNTSNNSSSNSNNNISGNNVTQENKKHSKYSTNNTLIQGYNINTTMNKVSSNAKNIYSKNVKGDNYINNNSGTTAANNREDSNNGTGGSVPYYHRNNINNSVGGNVAGTHNSGLSLKENNTDIKEANDNFSERNTNAYANDATYSNKGKNYNSNNAHSKSKIVNTAGNNIGVINNGLSARTGHTGNNMNHGFTNENVNEKDRHSNINTKGDKNNREEYKSNRNSYANSNNGTTNNNVIQNVDVSNNNINTNKFSEDKNALAVNKRGEIRNEKNNKQNDSSFKKKYNEMGNLAGTNGGNNVEVGGNVNSNEQNGEGEFADRTDNKRNTRNTDGNNENHNKINDKKIKNEEEKKTRKKNNVINVNGNVSAGVPPSVLETENMNKMVTEESGNMVPNDTTNINSTTVNNNNNSAHTKGSSYNAKNNKGYDRKTGEFTSWAKIAKTNFNKKKEKTNNLNGNMNHGNVASGGSRIPAGGNNSANNNSNNNNNNNNFVDAKEKDRERGVTQSGRGGESGYMPYEAMDKEKQKKEEEEKEDEGHHKVLKKGQDDKFENNARNKKLNYSNNKEYVVGKDMKDKQKSKYDWRKGEISDRRMNNNMMGNNNNNNMMNGINNTSGNYAHRSSPRDKIKIQNVELKHVDDKLLNSFKLDDGKSKRKGEEQRNCANVDVNYANESRSDVVSEKTQMKDAMKNKDIVKGEKGKEMEKEKIQNKLKNNLQGYQNEKTNAGAAVVAVASSSSVVSKNEESFTKQEGVRDMSTTNQHHKEGYLSAQNNRWNKSNENNMKQNGNVAACKDNAMGKVGNNGAQTSMNGSAGFYEKASFVNNSNNNSNNKNSIWEGKTSFAEVAKRKPQRGMREVKSEALITDGKSSSFNKSDKSNRKEHCRHFSNGTMREKGSMTTADNASTPMEIKKKSIDEKEERSSNMNVNNIKAQDQEKESVVGADATKVIKEKHTQQEPIRNVKVEKEIGAGTTGTPTATAVPIIEEKEKLSDIRSGVKGNVVRRDGKDTRDNKNKNIKSDKKEKSRELEDERDKLEKSKGRASYVNKSNNKMSNNDVSTGECKLSEKEKVLDTIKNKEESNKLETPAVVKVDNRKEGGQEAEQSEDINKKNKKKKKKVENEEDMKTNEDMEIVKDLSSTATATAVQENETLKEEKPVEEIVEVAEVGDKRVTPIAEKEMKVEEVETGKDLTHIHLEKEQTKQEEDTLKLKTTEETDINAGKIDNDDMHMISADVMVPTQKESVVKVDSDSVEKETEKKDEITVKEKECEQKNESERKENLKEVMHVASKEDTVSEAKKTDQVEKKKENEQVKNEMKEEAPVGHVEKREDDDILGRPKKNTNELGKQKDEHVEDIVTKEAEIEGKEKCNKNVNEIVTISAAAAASTTTTTTNSNNNNSNNNNNNDNNNSNTVNEEAKPIESNVVGDSGGKNNFNKEVEVNRKDKDEEGGEKRNGEKDARVVKMRSGRKYTKGDFLLIYVSHNWNKDAHGYFKPHAGIEHSVTMSHNYVQNRMNALIGTPSKNISSVRDADIARSPLMSSGFKNMSNTLNGQASGTSNMSENNLTSLNRNSYMNTNSSVSMNNSNIKRYGMNLSRTSLSPGGNNAAGDEDNDWRKNSNSVSKNLMNSLFANNNANNILFNNNNFGSNMMMDSLGQNTSGGINTSASNNILMKNISSFSDWRKNDGEKLKGFFDAQRVKDPVDTWRKSTPTKTYESSWLSKQNQLKADKYTCLMRKLRGILNRLTFEKFDLLYKELISVNFTKPEEVIGLLKLVFEKAVSQHHFVQMYVQLCLKLSKHFADVKFKDCESFSFKRLLINQCQDSFESYLKPIEYPPNMEGEDKFEFEQKHKNKVRGNMLFVGELVKSGIISVPIVFLCIGALLEKREDYIRMKNDTNVGNLHLEALCMFLNTIGEIIDTHDKIKNEDVTKLYDTLNKLVKDERIVFRVRCLIEDVIDNRNEKWNKKFAHKLEGPTTLSEIHDKVIKESIERNTKTQTNNNMGGGNLNYHDRLSSNLNNMRNNLLRGNFMNSSSNYMNNNNNNYMNNNNNTNSNTNNNNNNTNNNNNSSASNNVNTRGMTGMKVLDGIKNMKKMAMNLSKNKTSSKSPEDNKDGANEGNVNNNNSSGTGGYYDLMAKSLVGDSGRNNAFINEGGDNPLRNMDNSRLMNASGSITTNNTIMGKDKTDTKPFTRSYNMNRVNELMRKSDMINNDAYADINFTRGSNVGRIATGENSGQMNFINRSMKESNAITSSTGATVATNVNEKELEGGEKKEMTEEEFKKKIVPEISDLMRQAALTDDWDALTQQFKEVNIPPKLQEKANDIILKLTLKTFACRESLHRSADFFKWIIGSIVLQDQLLQLEAFKNSWETFLLGKDEHGYECTKEDYPLLPTIAENFVNGIEQFNENSIIYDTATLEKIKSVI